MSTARKVADIIARFIVGFVIGFPLAGALALAVGFMIASGMDPQSGGAFAMVMCLLVIPVAALAGALALGTFAITREWNPYPLLLILAVAYGYWHVNREQTIEETLFDAMISTSATE